MMLSLAWMRPAVTRTGRIDVRLSVCRLDLESVMDLSETRRALVRESGMGRQLPHSYVLQAPIALDAGRPSSVIRFRMLQAIIASASCDFG